MSRGGEAPVDWMARLDGAADGDLLLKARAALEQGQDPVPMLLERDVPADRIRLALSQEHMLPALGLSYFHPEPAALGLLDHETARRLKMLPLFVLEDRLFSAMADPWDLAAQDFVRRLAGYSVEPVLALRADLEEALNRCYLQGSGEVPSPLPSAPEPTGSWSFQAQEDAEAPAIRAVKELLTRAVLLRASDVHLEPEEGSVRIRYRIDGILHEVPGPNAALHPAVVSRIKLLSRLDIAERRLPQDGRCTLEVEGENYDLRVSVVPGLYGEGVAIRVLNPHHARRDLADLGLPADLLPRYERLIRRPYGIILVTGPTGSGKTTTLYSTLQKIYDPRRKIITLEEPVEYRLRGVMQIPIRSEIGLTFARVLRAILRHDPDVVMVGEIRDLESAEIAVRASLTGHLLFATLHTNNAALAATRLVDMGLKPYQVMASLVGVLAQRLVRRLCPDCRVEVPLTPAHLDALDLRVAPPGARLFEPRGCPLCEHLGYRGRTGIFELLEVTNEMRRLEPARLTPEGLLELARGTGMTTLRERALHKLFAGETSLDEVLNLTTEE